MAVELPETTIIEIRKNLIEVGQQIDTALVNENMKIENKEDQREKIWKENIIDKTKTTLSSDEKKRFIEISKIFVKQWVEQVKKLKQEQQKKGLLSGAISTLKKKATAPFRFISDYLKNKKKKMEKTAQPKKKMSWITKLLLIIGGLGVAWFLFKSFLKSVPDKVRKSLENLGGEVLRLGEAALDGLWDMIKSGLDGLWSWIKSVLHLDDIGKFISNAWNKLTGWFDGIWQKIVGVWEGVKKAVVEFPGKMWDWICSVAKSFFETIVNAVTTTWNWIKDKVLGVWNWISGQLKKAWEGLKKAWTGVVNFFSGIWKWVTDTFSWKKIWGAIKDYVSSFVGNIKESINLLLEGKIIEFVKRPLEKITGVFSNVIDKVRNSWLGRRLGLSDKQEDTKVTEKQVKTKVKSDVVNLIEKEKDIVLKDNILETVKDICDRINTFFSTKENGFIDLSNKLINKCMSGFTDMKNQIGNIKLKNVYEVDYEQNYHDTYDQSDHSVKTINNDYSKHSTDDYSITYNTLDIPALNNAVKTIENQNRAEIKLLASQNDYLAKMITNIDGLGDKLTWLDPNKFKTQQNNALIPIIGTTSHPGMNVFDTSHLKLAQRRYANALN